MIKKLERKDRRKPIDKAIDEGLEAIIDDVEYEGIGTEHQTVAIDNLKKLSDIRNSERRKPLEGVKEVLKDAIPAAITGVCGVLSVWLIINYEQTGIITTKSFPFVPKGRA